MMEEESPEFSEESLQKLDGKKFPLRLVPNGPIVGEGEFKYNSETGELIAYYTSDDPDVEDLLKESRKVIFKKERDG
jgi:hypothetical protein